MTTLAAIALGLAALPALIYLRNLFLFRPPPELPAAGSPRVGVSVLIPARNEEHTIAAAVGAVLASRGVELEIIVLDDHSEDGTAAAVRKLAAADPRVRLEVAPPLPVGWCGKQHACFALSKLARYDVLSFLDADVRLAPDGLARMAAFLRQSGAGLVSGFPRQKTGTLLEKLVLPLINWLLACYLPMGPRRRKRHARFAAGCGQWFMTTREAYRQAGGHAAVKASLHDGVTLPRAYRRVGMMTDVCDATDLAACRMYRSAGQVWNGLAKNAGEGLGSWPLILVWTLLLLGGHVLSWVGFPVALYRAMHPEPNYYWVPGPVSNSTVWVIHPPITPASFAIPGVFAVACLLSLLPRLDATRRFRGSWLGAVLHPVGVTVLLAVQWYALIRVAAGRPVGWKGRGRPALPGPADAG